MADRRRQRASQDTEDEESGASGSDSGGSPARGGGSRSGSVEGAAAALCLPSAEAELGPFICGEWRAGALRALRSRSV